VLTPIPAIPPVSKIDVSRTRLWAMTEVIAKANAGVWPQMPSSHRVSCRAGFTAVLNNLLPRARRQTLRPKVKLTERSNE